MNQMERNICITFCQKSRPLVMKLIIKRNNRGNLGPLRLFQDLLSKRGIGYEEVRAASKAGGGFFKFVLSVIGFYDVAKMIRPKRERVKMLERELAKAVKDLQMLKDAVIELEEMLFNLRRQFAEAQNEMERLRKEMNIMLRQLLAAEKLTTGLASEKIRCVLYPPFD